jgi:predicted TPR repeat methyltransferase
MTVDPWFPTLIYNINLTESVNNEILKDSAYILKNKNDGLKNEWRCDTFNTLDYDHSIDQVHDCELTNLINIVTAHVAEFAKEFHKADARILDFGCGTGLVGEELVKAGFDPKNIWGIDASQGMLDVTAKKNCYSDLIHMFLGQPATFREDLFNKFDVVTAAGILAEGHLMSEVFDEMLHALK